MTSATNHGPVIQAVKTWMAETGQFFGRIDAELTDEFSRSWFSFAGRTNGVVHTPQPDIGLQPPEVQQEILNRMQVIADTPAPVALKPITDVSGLPPIAATEIISPTKTVTADPETQEPTKEDTVDTSKTIPATDQDKFEGDDANKPDDVSGAGESPNGDGEDHEGDQH